jgi:hypothetical protein
VLLQEALEELPGIGPGLGAARFPAPQARKGQIKEMRPEKGDSLGLGKPVVLTPEKKQADRRIECFRWRPRASPHIQPMTPNRASKARKRLYCKYIIFSTIPASTRGLLA